MLVREYVGGACTRATEELPTQFLSRLRVHDPTAGVAEVWEIGKADFLLLITI